MKNHKSRLWVERLLLSLLLQAVVACEHEHEPPERDASVASCGNGTVDPLETCDPISTCATSCDDGNVCTADALVGNATSCDAACSHAPIVQCQNDDGCCPSGCDIGVDSDCPVVCGDGIVSQGETCDPTEQCSCDDKDLCTVDIQIGDPTKCNVECYHSPFVECSARDGCCPPRCSTEMDEDCRRSEW